MGWVDHMDEFSITLALHMLICFCAQNNMLAQQPIVGGALILFHCNWSQQRYDSVNMQPRAGSRIFE